MSYNFQYYNGNVKIPKPMGEINLDYICQTVKNPSDKMKSIFNSIALAEKKGDMKLKATLKQNNLYYVTPCVFTNGKGRKYDNIISFTGLLVLDFDHIDNSEEFKRFMFNKYKCIICAFLSPSKRGVKFVVRIPIVNTVDVFKSYYYGIGVEMEKYKGWDGSGQNCILPLFLSWDEDILIRDDYEVWQKKGVKHNAFKAFSGDVKTEIVEVAEGDKGIVMRNIKKSFESIVDNGHPQLRSACVSLGGFVASGYISESEAFSFVSGLIEAHGYLSKGVSGYKKTAKTAIQIGMKSQLKLQ